MQNTVKISLIAALAEGGVIGRQGDLPWSVPEDLRRFRQLTLGKPIIMGRKTLESIGWALPGRLNIILTTNPAAVAQYSPIHTATSVDDALRLAYSGLGEAKEVMVIGGGQVYRQFLPYATEIHQTQIETLVEGDTFFPLLDDSWVETYTGSSLTSSTGLRYSYHTLTRPTPERTLHASLAA